MSLDLKVYEATLKETKLILGRSFEAQPLVGDKGNQKEPGQCAKSAETNPASSGTKPTATAHLIFPDQPFWPRTFFVGPTDFSFLVSVSLECTGGLVRFAGMRRPPWAPCAWPWVRCAPSSASAPARCARRWSGVGRGSGLGRVEC